MIVVAVGGRCSRSPITTTAAPASAATAYRSARSTVGISASSTSRTMPPPMPVSMPSSAAMTGFNPKASAFCAPATAKSASPAASKMSTGLRKRSTDRIRVEGDDAGKQRHREIAPVADRAGGTDPIRTSRVIPPKFAGHKRQDQNAEQIEPALHPRHRPADREDEGAGKIKHKQKRHRGSPSHNRANRKSSPSDRLRVNAECAAPTTRPAPRQPAFPRRFATSDG